MANWTISPGDWCHVELLGDREESKRFYGIRPDDFDATLAAIREGGGEVLIPKTDVLGYGWFAHFRDPAGNVVGLWEDAPHDR